MAHHRYPVCIGFMLCVQCAVCFALLYVQCRHTGGRRNWANGTSSLSGVHWLQLNFGSLICLCCVVCVMCSCVVCEVCIVCRSIGLGTGQTAHHRYPVCIGWVTVPLFSQSCHRKLIKSIFIFISLSKISHLCKTLQKII